MKHLYTFALAAVLLAGCQTISDNPELSMVVVQYATIKVCKDHPERAAAVIKISTQVRAASSGESFDTVAALMLFISEKINWGKLAQEDQLLARALLQVITQALIDRIGPGELTGPNILVVNEVAGWIEDAARATTSPDKVDQIEARAKALRVE